MKINTDFYIDRTDLVLYFRDLQKRKPLTVKAERQLIKQINDGCNQCDWNLVQQLKFKLVEANLRFVISMAKQYQNQGLPVADLIAEGNMGLMIAATKFDYANSTTRFYSYAVHWIKQRIISALNDHSRLIRLPVNVINDTLQEKKGKKKTDKSINKVPLPKIFKLMAPIDDNGTTLFDVIENTNTPHPDFIFDTDNYERNETLYEILKYLNPIECSVIIKYFGLDGEPMSLKELSKELHLTTERIRQIKIKAIQKTRSRAIALSHYQ